MKHETLIKHNETLVKHNETLVKHYKTLVKHHEILEHSLFDATISVLDVATLALCAVKSALGTEFHTRSVIAVFV